MNYSDRMPEFVDRIASHAYQRHVDPNDPSNAEKKNQFDELGIDTQEQMQAHISELLAKDDVLIQSGMNDRCCVYDADTNTAVIINPHTHDRGTCFRPGQQEEYIENFRGTERKRGMKLDVRACGMRDYQARLEQARAKHAERDATLKKMDSFVADTRGRSRSQSQAADKKPGKRGELDRSAGSAKKTAEQQSSRSTDKDKGRSR